MGIWHENVGRSRGMDAYAGGSYTALQGARARAGILSGRAIGAEDVTVTATVGHFAQVSMTESRIVPPDLDRFRSVAALMPLMDQASFRAAKKSTIWGTRCSAKPPSRASANAASVPFETIGSSPVSWIIRS